MNNKELVKLWSNDEKIRAFVKTYKEWGVWFTVKELKLTYYKYDLPDGVRIIVMKYLKVPYGEKKPTLRCNHYLQRSEHFDSDTVSDYEISNHLKDLKEKWVKEGIT